MRADLIREIVAFDPLDWMSSALCAQIGDPDLHFPGPGEKNRSRSAKRVCLGCSVREECAAYGAGERWGVWGGRTEHERRGVKS